MRCPGLDRTPDFENFSEEYVSTGDGNYCTKGGSTSCGDMILEKGYLHYDAYRHADLVPYHYTCGNFRSKTGAKGDWSNPVYYTPGMVQKNLVFAPTPDGRLDMYDGVFIQKANDLCDNSNFHQWYSA